MSIMSELLHMMAPGFEAITPRSHRQLFGAHSGVRYANHSAMTCPSKRIDTSRAEQCAAHHCEPIKAGIHHLSCLQQGLAYWYHSCTEGQENMYPFTGRKLDNNHEGIGIQWFVAPKQWPLDLRGTLSQPTVSPDGTKALSEPMLTYFL